MLDTNTNELHEALKALGKGTHTTEAIECKILELRTAKQKPKRKKTNVKK